MSDSRSILVNSQSTEPLRDGPKSDCKVSINQDGYKLSSKLVRGLTRLLFLPNQGCKFSKSTKTVPTCLLLSEFG